MHFLCRWWIGHRSTTKYDDMHFLIPKKGLKISNTVFEVKVQKKLMLGYFALTACYWILHTMESSSNISYRERVHVCALTMRLKIQRKTAKKSAIRQALMDANGGDESTITVRKKSATISTKKCCFAYSSNLYCFIPYRFGTISRENLRVLNEYLAEIENERQPRNMIETLLGSDAKL